MDRLSEYDAYEFIPYAASNLTSTTPAPDTPSLKIKHTSTWTYCGPLLSPPQLPQSLHTWSNAAVSSPSTLHQRLSPLLTFLHTFLSAEGVQHYWLTLRATLPTPEYDSPRWHTDDTFSTLLSRFSPDPSPAPQPSSPSDWKLCTTLLGPSTLFLALPRNSTALATLHSVNTAEAARRPHACPSIRCAACFDTGAAVRSTLSRVFADEQVVQAGEGEVVVFRTGAARGAVHSEPRCDGHRVFVNVVPGTERELRALMGRFGMGFPRAWSLGVGLEDRDGLDGLGGMVDSDDSSSA